MKKGIWQQDHKEHTELYGDSFIEYKNFTLDVDQNIIDNYMIPFWNSRGGKCDIYEFGVYTGGSLRDTIKKLKHNQINPNMVWGFDSFEGLPIETEGMATEGKHWNEGAFSTCDALNIWDWSELEKKLLETINSDNVKLVKGFYENTLTDELISESEFKPAMFVNIDVDLYRSTIEVLEWLFKNKLVEVGTVIRYDDVLFVPETTGELQAHKEICEKYSVTCNRLDTKYFVVTEIK